MVYIYKLTAPNGKVYIGQTGNIKKRFKCYNKGNCKSQTKLYNSLQKYGFDNFNKEILIGIENIFADFYEESFINFYDSVENGLNIQKYPGHSNLGMKRSEETKKKIRAAMLGMKRGPLSEEHKQKIREVKLGKKRENIIKEIKRGQQN